MLKIGLTGGIGSGKSTISNMLRKRGFNILDVDMISRDVLILYPDILKKVKECFGENFFDENGNLRRREFGNFIFSREDKRKDYESIIIPYIVKEIFNKIERLEKEKYEVCILDAPTLIENGLHSKMDINVLVWVDLNTQIKRIKRRDNLSETEAINRINSQMPLKEKREFVDYIIDNSHTIERTKEELERVLQEIARRYRGVKCLKT